MSTQSAPSAGASPRALADSRSRARTHRTARATAFLVIFWLGLTARVGSRETGAWSSIEIDGKRAAPSETARFFVSLAKTTGGEIRMLDTLVVVTRGVKPGPSLCLIAGIHGDELNGIEIAHRIYAETSAAQLSGTLIAVPAVNIAGLRTGNRYLPDRRDLNRGFPGNPNGSLASRISSIRA